MPLRKSKKKHEKRHILTEIKSKYDIFNDKMSD